MEKKYWTALEKLLFYTTHYTTHVPNSTIHKTSSLFSIFRFPTTPRHTIMLSQFPMAPNNQPLDYHEKMHAEYMNRLMNFPADITGMSEVNLRCFGVSHEQIKNLATMLETNKSVTKVNLQQNGVDDAGVQELVRGLTNNTHNTELNLAVNNITNVGAACIANMLRVNRTMRLIRLNNGLITNDGVAAIICAINQTGSQCLVNLEDNYWNEYCQYGRTVHEHHMLICRLYGA